MHPTSRVASSLLAELEGGQGTSQRALAWRCGIALGRTNLLLREFLREGLVAISEARPRYVLTARGQERKAQLDRDRLKETIESYDAARRHIERRLGELIDRWPAGRPKRVGFVGSGVVAEIVFACLQGRDVRLVAVFDSCHASRAFFGFHVRPVSEINSMDPEDLILVTFLDIPPDIATAFDSFGVAPERLLWL